MINKITIKNSVKIVNDEYVKKKKKNKDYYGRINTCHPINISI